MHFSVLAALLAAAAASGAARPALTPADMAGWTIVCDGRATASERYAAGEFQTLFRGLTGKTLPIADSAPAAGGAVYIGPDAVRQTGRAMPAIAAGDEEALRIRLDSDALCIDGGRPRGTLYGVYEFFEEMCGVRYLTVDHTYFPADGARRRLPAGTRSYEPQFKFRWSYYGETNQRPEFAARLHTNTVSDDARLGGRTGYQLVSHNVSSLVPPATYGREHPEYYALVNGKRLWDTPDGGGPQLCLTNPHVRDIVVSAVLDQIAKRPDLRNINIAQMDNGSYCTCPDCAALDTREGSHAATMITFVNSVAEAIEKTHPNVLLSTYAYQYTRKPPATLRPRRNVMIQLCSIECCDLHAIDDPTCPLNRAFARDMAVWKTRCDQIFIWHYNTDFAAYMLPFPNLREIGRSVAYFAANSGRGVFMQAAGNAHATDFSDLRNYVMSRCLWKPGRDSWAETREFCRLHYAEAAPPILALLAAHRKLVDGLGTHPTCFATESALGLTPAVAKRMVAGFERAAALARSPEVRERVARASLCAMRAAIGTAAVRLQVADGLCRADARGLDAGVLDRYAALCTRFGVTMDAETVPQEEYLGRMRALVTGIPAATIENASWRVSILPELGARAVEMVYRPAGRNVIEAPRALDRFRYEAYVRDGAGPNRKRIVAYTVTDRRPDRVTAEATTEDGARFVQTISLVNDAVRFDMEITAGMARTLDPYVHPEYYTGTTSAAPSAISVYIRRDGLWAPVHPAQRDAPTNPAQEALIRGGASGGAFAYFSHTAGFGVEQRFDPARYAELGVSWIPSRFQLNLEMYPKPSTLAAGEQARYSYEVRYLAAPLP